MFIICVLGFGRILQHFWSGTKSSDGGSKKNRGCRKESGWLGQAFGKRKGKNLMSNTRDAQIVRAKVTFLMPL